MPQVEKVDEWLRSVLWDSKLPGSREGETPEFEVYRLKARLPLAGGKMKIVQGVRDVFEIRDAPPDDEAPTTGKMIIIGKDIGNVGLEESLLSMLR
jgi:hypothetical protein